MIIREATEADYNKIWEIFSRVIQAGDSYVFHPDTPKSALKNLWLADNMETFVLEDEGQIHGTYFIKPNQIGLGNHIANCGYMVHPDARGRGTGSKLCEHSLAVARDRGYSGMQFNMVVSTNAPALALWKRFGFKIIGTTPNGFRHVSLGLVDTYIMFKNLNE